jgi:hexosaminidase
MGTAVARAAAAVGWLASMRDVTPVPALVTPVDGTVFPLHRSTRIYADPDAAAVGSHLAEVLRRATGYPLPIVDASRSGISLLLTGADPRVGEEGYQLDVTASAVVLRAARPAGLFAGVQTLRQLLPPAVESGTAQPGPWLVPAGRIVDWPRYPYRSAMLDVARHFLPVPAVERYIDLIARYKLNHLHLHLTDDQGWRIAIGSWPRLAEVGGRTEVGGGEGGHYTQDDYRRLVEYARARHITVVPEIDMPGHVNSALVAYPDLNGNGRTAEPYTGIDVGFSSLCVDRELTYTFVDNVIGEVAALTPGPYLHIGGDEADATSPDDYVRFMDRVQRIVAAHGKTVIGWHQLAHATPLPSTILQYWATTPVDRPVLAAAQRGNPIVLSPADKTYLDQKYDADSPLGLTWAGPVSVRDAYDWDPAGHLTDVDPAAVLGIEAPLWTETVRSTSDLEYLALPRLPAIAELAWSPPESHDWNGFCRRLGAQGPRWTVMGVNFHRAPEIPWYGAEGYYLDDLA